MDRPTTANGVYVRMGPEWFFLARGGQIQLLLWTLIVVGASLALVGVGLSSACPSCPEDSFVRPWWYAAAAVGAVAFHVLLVVIARPRFRSECRAWMADAQAQLAAQAGASPSFFDLRPGPTLLPVRVPLTGPAQWERLLARSKVGTLVAAEVMLADVGFFVSTVDDFLRTYSNALALSFLAMMVAVPLVFWVRRMRGLRRRAQEELKRLVRTQVRGAGGERAPDFQSYWGRLRKPAAGAGGDPR